MILAFSCYYYVPSLKIVLYCLAAVVYQNMQMFNLWLQLLQALKCSSTISPLLRQIRYDAHVVLDHNIKQRLLWKVWVYVTLSQD